MKIPRWITKDFWAKIASVSLAFILWMYVSGEQNMEVTHEIPVELRLPANFVLAEINSPSLRATFYGAKSILQKIDFEKIQYYRDLGENPQPGKFTFLVSEGDIRLPKFLSVKSMSPGEITVTIDRLVEKELAVEPELVGTPLDGFKVEGVSVNPSVARVKGPATILQRSSKVKTEDVAVTGRNRSFFQKVPISPFIRGQESELMVEVYVRIREEVEEKVFDNHPVKILQSVDRSWKIQLDPRTASVLVGGNKEILDRLTPTDITLFLDLADLKPGSYELPLQSNAPKQVRVLKVTPSSIKAREKVNPPNTIPEAEVGE